MAKKISYNPIENLNQDWSLDETNGFPFSGQSVQEFIKQYLAEADTAFKERVGACYYEPSKNILYLFKNNEDLELWRSEGGQDPSDLFIGKTQFNFTSTIYQLQILTNFPTNTIWYSADETAYPLTLSFTSKSKGITEETWVDTNEDANFTVAVDRGNVGTYNTIISNRLVSSGDSLSIDLKNFLSNGENRVRITCTGVMTGESTTRILNTNVTSMYLRASNFAWYTPFKEGSIYQLGGMKIGGTIDKNLFVRIKNSNNTYIQTYQKNLGPQVWINTEYFFSELEFPTTGTDIYNVEIWVQAADGSLETDHLFYNIMCVAAEDIETAQLVCINEVAETAMNYQAERLFNYAIYNQNTASGNPLLKLSYVVRGVETEISEETLYDVETSVSQSYQPSLSIASDDSNVSVLARAIYGNTQTVTIALDNSASYPPTSGYSFYLNPANRSNTQLTKTQIINEVTGQTIPTTSTNMSFMGKGDGWIVDNNNVGCLFVPAGCLVDMNYGPLANIVNGRKTIEFTFKIRNISDYNDNVITICDNPLNEDFRGIRIRATDITVHSRALNSSSLDAKQSYNFGEDNLINICFTICQNYKTNYGNFAIIYVNGVKKCEFAYTNTDSWMVNSHVLFGSNSADLYLYNMRVYEFDFGFPDAFQNYVASLPGTLKQVAYEKGLSVIDDSWNIDYDAVSRKANTMVIEITDPVNTDLPQWHVRNKKYSTKGNVEFHYNEDHTKDCKMYDIEVMGQGTTSMNYFRWNLRFRIDKSNNEKKVDVSYFDASGQELERVKSKTVIFDGKNENNIPIHTPIKRITAKTNYASSPQSHKMGATAMFNDLHNQVVGPNEADGMVAVFEHPFYGFQKIKIEGTDQYRYEFIGFFTAGPDKGDKPTFKYDDAAYEDTLITAEGMDHSTALATFSYPWNTQVQYVASEEALCVNKNDGTYEAGIEIGNCCGLGTDDPNDQNAIQNKLERRFKPAYNIGQENSTLLKGVTQTLEEINSDVNGWRSRVDPITQRNYSQLLFFTDGIFDVYYYNLATRQYENSGINLLTQLEISAASIALMNLNERTEHFKELRREKFYAEFTAPDSPWHVDDCLFQYVFLLMIGATDNFAKNSYPYSFANKWRWRQDDLDTIFDIDNQGLATKKYSIEVEDLLPGSSTGRIFNGENNTLWTLIRETMSTRKHRHDEQHPNDNDDYTYGNNEIRSMGQRILEAMRVIGGKTDTFESLMAFFEKYFWGKAQNYFTKTAYNIDAECKYEDAYADTEYRGSVDVNPLEQSLGDHIEAEMQWVERRMIYLMSKFYYGPFANYADGSLSKISFRPLSSVPLTVTPALDMYPAAILGQTSASHASERIPAGTPYTLAAIGGENTNVYIAAADYLQDIGDLSTIKLDNSVSLNIKGKRLQRIKIGDEFRIVESGLTGVELSNLPSVQVFDARNVGTLVGSVDLSSCIRLKEAYFEGTGITEVVLPDNSKIEVLHYSSKIVTVSLKGLQSLRELTHSSPKSISVLQVENCSISGLELLVDAFEAGALSNEGFTIRLVGFNETLNNGTSIVAAIACIAKGRTYGIPYSNATDDYQYYGYDASGNVVDYPVIEGVLTVDHCYYEDYVEAVRYFPNLTINVTETYIYFKDAKVREILSANFGTSYISLAQAQSVVSLSDWFQNSGISEFKELKYFTNLVDLSETFRGCLNIKKISIPDNCTKFAIETIRNLEEIEISEHNVLEELSLELLPYIKFNVIEEPYQKFIDTGYTPSIIQTPVTTTRATTHFEGTFTNRTQEDTTQVIELTNEESSYEYRLLVYFMYEGTRYSVVLFANSYVLNEGILYFYSDWSIEMITETTYLTTTNTSVEIAVIPQDFENINETTIDKDNLEELIAGYSGKSRIDYFENYEDCNKVWVLKLDSESLFNYFNRHNLENRESNLNPNLIGTIKIGNILLEPSYNFGIVWVKIYESGVLTKKLSPSKQNNIAGFIDESNNFYTDTNHSLEYVIDSEE